MLKKRILVSCLLSIGLFGLVEHSYATESDFSSFSVEGIPNEKQLDPDAGYFYLREEPGSQDKLKLKIQNNSSEKKTFTIKVTDANTNSNGLIDYTGQLPNASELALPLTSVINPKQQEVTVSKNSIAEANIDISMPKEPQPGVLMGGIVVSEKKDNENESKTISIGNTYSYTLGVLLTNENDKIFNKNISVQLKNVEAKLSNGRKIIQGAVLNNNPYVFGTATMTGKVVEERSTKIVKEKKQNDINIAPYSVFPFQIDYKKDELRAGNYVFEGNIKTKEKTWHFSKKFVITEKEAQDINNKSVFRLHIPSWLIYSSYILAILNLLLLILIFLIWGKKHE
ncbi:DUF916 and DUF3324 domain-containing protein [Enterococcus hulanensis]|uniref:DUF916 and DUF3324 domain-containing protein n=1 Tax=Enterococcus hulanensis TaxID=2559929 RepID=A0ABU3F1G7_9ENTE|nr:DUF916 and DUF3324 domain-containing protein [Enterococcus hulanensis]MDT2600973.1 DUF916 and DUF3324 domain-containing protein [Enterococcus hulanensis]MDT2611562.1 DUF916 and DUF3324 domain-containing protein [Enterococcus hulanensis]MDT2617954.1 DUF916 and DUF3324 domain-containing protein [Enterococcus hulanensis]MDT2628957.1 DUF916 and DUF3324 domain-containing protein [Enterococcus hulanensis]MDT2656519.1 DUF916 and DUF3324 domain-containing protein [Enterococcus hulanensis]